MKSLLKRAAKEAKAYFQTLIFPSKNHDGGDRTYYKSGNRRYVSKVKLGKSRPRRGKMAGEV